MSQNHDQIWQKCSKSAIFEFLAQKASKVIISLFSGFWESSMKMRGVFFSKGGTQSWPGTAIVNHPLRLQSRRRLSYFPYIFYFVNFTISAAIRLGLFGSFENVIKDFPKFGDFRICATFCVCVWRIKSIKNDKNRTCQSGSKWWGEILGVVHWFT